MTAAHFCMERISSSVDWGDMSFGDECMGLCRVKLIGGEVNRFFMQRDFRGEFVLCVIEFPKNLIIFRKSVRSYPFVLFEMVIVELFGDNLRVASRLYEMNLLLLISIVYCANFQFLMYEGNDVNRRLSV